VKGGRRVWRSEREGGRGRRREEKQESKTTGGERRYRDIDAVYSPRWEKESSFGLF